LIQPGIKQIHLYREKLPENKSGLEIAIMVRKINRYFRLKLNLNSGDTLQIPLFTHNCDNGIKVSQNNQALDTWTLLQYLRFIALSQNPTCYGIHKKEKRGIESIIHAYFFV